jgi:hypothetical protein
LIELPQDLERILRAFLLLRLMKELYRTQRWETGSQRASLSVTRAELDQFPPFAGETQRGEWAGLSLRFPSV